MADYRVIARKIKLGADCDKADFIREANEKFNQLGTSLEDTNAIKPDLPLEAIEGRGTVSQRAHKFNFDLGKARHFKANEVTKLAEAPARFSEADLRKSFTEPKWQSPMLVVSGWLEEKDSVFNKFLPTAFRTLQTFCQQAEKSGHHVFFIY